MDKMILERKLDSLQRCITRITAKCPQDPQALMDNIDLQDIVVLNLSRAIQLCVGVGLHCLSRQTLPSPGTMGETFDLLAKSGIIDSQLAHNLKKSVGFRNIAVHNYTALDIQIVHALATRHIKDFQQYYQAIAATLIFL